MKKVDYAQKALGMVFSPDFGDHIQHGMIDRFAALIKGLVGVNNLVVKLWGCDIVVAGQDYTMSAGALYYNGVIYTVDAFAGTAPAGEVGLWTIDDTYTGQSRFGDDQLKDTFLENKMTLSFGASGSGIADHDAAITIEEQIYIHATVQAKTQALIDASIAALVDSSPGTLDTLNELAAALGDDPNFATTMTNALAGKVAIADVINVLTSTETQKPLSAAQGKALNDAKIAISAIVNNLTSTATNAPLSAAQGKVLQDNKAALSIVIKKDGTVAFTGHQSMGGFRLTNLGTPFGTDNAALRNAALVSGSLVLADFVSGVSAVSYADYEYFIIGNICFFAFRLSLTTTSYLIKFNLPGTLRHKGYDTDIYWRSSFADNGKTTWLTAEAENEITQRQVRLSGPVAGGNYPQFSNGTFKFRISAE